MAFGVLYIVATPIGNLEDTTLRAVRILKEVDFILAEDTRKTSILLRHYDIQNSILSYHQHSPDSKKFDILRRIIAGKNSALVTDAGTPGISDPGNELISFLLEKEPNIKIVPIPGPSAISTVVSISGLNLAKFIFLGFMPKKGKTKLFKWLADSKMPFIFYDSPNRLVKTLSEVGVSFPEAFVVVGRELTKMYEEVTRGKISEVLSKIENGDKRGEVVVVVKP